MKLLGWILLIVGGMAALGNVVGPQHKEQADADEEKAAQDRRYGLTGAAVVIAVGLGIVSPMALYAAGIVAIIAGLLTLVRPLPILQIPTRRAGVAVLASGIIISAIASGLLDDGTPGATPAAPEEPAASQPAPEPEPAEPVQAPAATEPEADPEPEPPLWTAEETAYRLWVVRHTAEFSEVLRGLGGLLQEPRMWEQEWVVQVGARIAQMRLLVQEAQEQEAPEAFASVHAHYMDAMDDYGYVAEHLPRAIDDLDADLLEELVERMERGAARVSAAAEEVTRLVAERER